MKTISRSNLVSNPAWELDQSTELQSRGDGVEVRA